MPITSAQDLQLAIINILVICLQLDSQILVDYKLTNMAFIDWPVRLKDNSPRCELLGSFAIVVQASMGLLAVASLVFKRYREHPRRPWWVWFFDVLKQVFGAAGLHTINLLMSILFSSSEEPGVDDNPCTWYFVNILLDTTVGVPLLWFCLYMVHTCAFRLGITGIISGQYGHPPRWLAFFKQASLYLIALIGMKILLYIFAWWTPFVDDFGELLISWTDFDGRVQVAFVMLIFPLV